MKHCITAKNVTIDDALHEHIEQRIYFAFSRFSPRISRVSVMVEDVNGPRGGIDKRCRIVVKLKRGGEVAVEATDADMSAAASAAADRAGRAVQRELERRRTLERKPPKVTKTDDALEDRNAMDD
jgi:ribosomal subunit interface protein